MSESYRLEVKDGEVHLILDGFFGTDFGSLHKTLTGKLVTNHLFGENYELEDISGFFSKGQKYRFKKSNGEQGVLIKRGNRYDFVSD